MHSVRHPQEYGAKAGLLPSLDGEKKAGIALLHGEFVGADHAQILKVVDDHRSLFPD